jgi:hypothetical protein
MIAEATPILVRPYTSALEFERRQGERHKCRLDATTHSLDSQDTLAWGASVRDISRTGVGLTLCFPFRAGTYLALDLHGTHSDKPATTVLSRVVHVRDQNDGSWHVGCEFVKALGNRELESLLAR